MNALARLAGVEVGVQIWGLGEDASILATLQGVLRLRDTDAQVVLPLTIREATGEEAVVFRIGEHWGNDLSFWPSRFVRAENVLPRRSVKVMTADGIVIVGPNQPGLD